MAKIEKEPNPLTPLFSLGISMAVGMVLFAGIGYYLDQKRGGGEMFTLIGVFLGLLYCGYETWKSVKQINKQ